MVCGYMVVKLSAEFNGAGSEVVSVASLDADAQSTNHITNHFTLVCLYHQHRNFKDKFLISLTIIKLQYAVMQYMFENGIDIPVITPPW